MPMAKMLGMLLLEFHQVYDSSSGVYMQGYAQNELLGTKCSQTTSEGQSTCIFPSHQHLEVGWYMQL